MPEYYVATECRIVFEGKKVTADSEGEAVSKVRLGEGEAQKRSDIKYTLTQGGYVFKDATGDQDICQDGTYRPAMILPHTQQIELD